MVDAEQVRFELDYVQHELDGLRETRLLERLTPGEEERYRSLLRQQVTLEFLLGALAP